MINLVFTTPQILSRALAFGSFLLIMAALYFEHVMGLHPCKMCLWQRTPHYVVIGLGLLSLLPPSRPYHRIIIAFMGLSLLVGSGIAFWHSGVELKLLPGPSSCSAAMSLIGDPAALLDQMLAAPAPRCDEVPWSFLGLSMANWNLAITFTMSLCAFICIFKTKAVDKRY